MLQLILGIAGTGKTTYILKQMQERASLQKTSVFLVPEQFSSSAETLVLETLGDEGSAFVEVVSFRTLANRMLQGADENLNILSDAGRAVFVKKALKMVQDKLQRFGRNKKDTAFCNLCAQTMAELKTAGATSKKLEHVARKTQDSKFSDLAILFSAYEAVLAGSAMDPEDRLHLACQKADLTLFSQKICYIDNFDGFTAPEYDLLCCLMQACEGVCVGLCCDHLQETEDGLGLFSPPRNTAQRLLRYAKQFGIVTLSPLTLTIPKRSGTQELLCANLLLAGCNYDVQQPEGSITVTEAESRYAEVKMVAAEMHRLAVQGMSYSKMALICRDVSVYESIVRREMALFDIPWHSDTPDTIEFSAPIAFFRAALRLIWQGINSASILELVKTGLCGFSQENISALENYVFTWKPNAAQWREPFLQNPKGLMQEMDEMALQSQQEAEAVRSTMLPKLETFLQKAKGKNAHNFSLQLYRLMESVNAVQHHEEKAERMESEGDFTWAERSRRAWDLSMGALDQMALLLEGEAISAAEYDEMLMLLVRSTDFGQTPKTLESVLFASADHVRLAEADYCFVLGLLEGEFPANVGYSGLLTHGDRDVLVENEIEMPGSFQNRILLEQMFFYRTVTAARKKLHLSYPLHHTGVMGVPCTEVTFLQSKLALPSLEIKMSELSTTKEAAFDRLASIYRENTQEKENLLAALSQPKTRFDTQRLQLLQQVDVPQFFRVENSDTLRALMGKNLKLSPTKVERYFQCRFAYLMEHVLHIRQRRKAEFSSLESGSLVHYVLEQVLKETGSSFTLCDDDGLRLLTEKYVEEFIDANFLETTLRLQNILTRVKETTVSLLQYLRNFAKQSSFETQALELAIGDREVPALSLQSENGANVQVVGKVDRVDLFKKDGKTYICILDYKTGNQLFNLDEVLYGINLQMLVYMSVLCRQKKGPYHGAIPAGVLYLSADPSPKSGARYETDKSRFHLDGLLLDDPDVLQALDSDKSGIFLPIRYKKDGTPSGKQLASLQRLGGLTLHVEALIKEMAAGLSEGDFSAQPLVKSGGVRPCQYCPYLASCRHVNGRNEVPVVHREGLLNEIDERGQQEGAKRERS